MSRFRLLPALLFLAALPLLAKPTPDEWKKLENEAKRANCCATTFCSAASGVMSLLTPGSVEIVG